LKRLASEIRDDLALVEIEPPLPGDVYGEKRDIRRLVLAARHEGTTLFPITRLPMAVYICLVNDLPEEPSDSIRSEDLRIVDWGEVQPVSSLRGIFTINPKQVVIDAITDDLLAGADDDYVGLWQVVDGVKKYDKSLSEEQIRAGTLQVVFVLLRNGMVVGNLLPGGGFDPWPTQDAIAVTSIVEREWRTLGHSPEIGDICWFDRGDAGPEGPK
jgi:hypothetical protein